ncbi:MAG: nucleoside diphosphate kinase regulator [Burkholderiales bacterium]|nr:nucleoside diphosphate kinase regulator [Burkholderiales bacterium]
MSKKPPITISSLDLERLETLIESTPDAVFPGKAALLDELGRATVLEPNEMPPDVVTMNSTVRFSVADSGQEFELTLVYPRDAGGEGRISVLAPVGSALLGLSVGSALDWPLPDGPSTTVRVSAITYQPERAGEHHR